MFDELKRSTAWRRLYERIVGDKSSFMDSLTKRLMRGDRPSRQEIAYMRGFYTGALWIVSHPEHAENSLEKAARHAYTLSNILGTEQEEDGLYG